MKRLGSLVAGSFLFAAHLGCSLGQGEGEVKSEKLIAKECWDQGFDLGPNFFAAVPSNVTLQIRIQRGNDLQEVSDGLEVLVDDVEAIRAGLLRQGLPISLPSGAIPPGTTLETPVQGEHPVHMSLYLGASCHNQNVVLYALGGTITFNALFSGDPNEKEASEKFTDAKFDMTVGDPRDAPTGGKATDVPVEKQSHVTGFFKFYFERGQPGQPFP
jgi:hypothetical protein